MPYLFVHFREKTTPDGEQVHFGLSKDGFHWEEVNEGRPILWAYYGDKGVRDFTIARNKTGDKAYIFATDLSLSYGMRNQYHDSWQEIAEHGSKHLSVWESEDLVHWSEQRLVRMVDDDFGCVWAPDIIYDKANDDYVIHWSSSHAKTDYKGKAIYSIYYSRTKDFETFSEPQVLYEVPGGDVIDSAIYEEDGVYYMFVKSERDPAHVQLFTASEAAGPYTKMDAFDPSMEDLECGRYEAPTAVKLDDGRWCLFLDHYGVKKIEQGYVPFICDDIATGEFKRSDESFSFPYGFKHGTILKITQEEYDRIANFDFAMTQY